jgi:hypothetical protein
MIIPRESEPNATVLLALGLGWSSPLSRHTQFLTARPRRAIVIERSESMQVPSAIYCVLSIFSFKKINDIYKNDATSNDLHHRIWALLVASILTPAMVRSTADQQLFDTVSL